MRGRTQIIAGTSGLFDTNGTQVLPFFIDEDGEITLDDDDFPKNANFYIDSRDGNAYFRGKVIATSGEFNGKVKAQDFMLDDGSGSMKSILKKVDGQDKIAADWLDLYGINVKNDAGTTVLRIDENGIRFAGSGNCQFSKNGSSNWHYPMESGDEYRRDFIRFGEQDTIVWGPAYRIVGRNGSNGSDANVTRANIERALAFSSTLGSSYMAVDSMGSPIIYGGKIFGSEIYAGGSVSNGTIVGTGAYISLTSDGLTMSNAADTANLQIAPKTFPSIGAVTQISSGSSSLAISGMNIHIGYGFGEAGNTGMSILSMGTEFYGNVDFSGANVTGIVARFG